MIKMMEKMLVMDSIKYGVYGNSSPVVIMIKMMGEMLVMDSIKYEVNGNISPVSMKYNLYNEEKSAEFA